MILTIISVVIYLTSMLSCRWFDRKNPEMDLHPFVWLCPIINTLFWIMCGVVFLYAIIEDWEFKTPKFILFIRNKITTPICLKFKMLFDWFFNKDIRR